MKMKCVNNFKEHYKTSVLVSVLVFLVDFNFPRIFWFYFRAIFYVHTVLRFILKLESLFESKFFSPNEINLSLTYTQVEKL